MPLNRPHGPDLVAAVREWLLAQARPDAGDALAYEARIAANLLDILEREMTLGPGFAQRERDGLAALLGRAGSPAELTEALSEAIRHGDIAVSDPRLLGHLRHTALAKLEIENPKYSAYRRARGSSG